jgi:hypothetical protein
MRPWITSTETLSGTTTYHGQLAFAALAVVGVALLASACGKSPSSGVANLGRITTTTATTSLPHGAKGSGPAAKYRAALAYVDCMRSHGVSAFPDPTSGGQINVNFATGGKDGSPASSGINRNSPSYLTADQACRHLLPGGVPTPAQTQLALAKGVKFAQCMRTHGEPSYPDPTSANVVHLGANMDPSAPEFQSAQKTCASLLPGSGSK